MADGVAPYMSPAVMMPSPPRPWKNDAELAQMRLGITPQPESGWNNAAFMDILDSLSIALLSNAQGGNWGQALAQGLAGSSRLSLDRKERERQARRDELMEREYLDKLADREWTRNDKVMQREDEERKRDALIKAIMGGDAPTESGGAGMSMPADTAAAPAGGQGIEPTGSQFNLPPELEMLLPYMDTDDIQSAILDQAKQGTKAPPQRTIIRDGMEVNQEYVGGQWNDVGSGPRWAPEKPADPADQFGSGVSGKSLAAVYTLAPKIADGTATADEQRRYALAYNETFGPKTVIDPTGSTVVIQPGAPDGIPKPNLGQRAQQTQAAPAPNMAAETIDLPGGGSITRTPSTKFTEGQAASALYADRINQAVPIIDQFEGAGLDLGEKSAAGIPIFGNMLVSPEYQRFDQASRDFINATLRRESGAVISPSEFENAYKQYLPQPGDSEQVLSQKRRNRETVLSAMQRSAGPAYSAPASSGDGGQNEKTTPDTEDNPYAGMSDEEVLKQLQEQGYDVGR